jgi:hypothetical protein
VISRHVILVSFHCLAVFEFLPGPPTCSRSFFEKHRTLGIKVSL